ncbi:hypothetical protein [Ammoniphilus resinae]|uniref:Uncharacterized protein n=1 Tax=Ammoniphilus resinae TaxID=861532 RepID=A0ABS4GKY8_9BACL|nr:hypothetical protein [Ammoniphilus resinae]MBP1930918.1 hypothetical protein [Ammoniphilus resinae]
MMRRYVLFVLFMLFVFSATSMSVFMLIGNNLGASLGIFAASLINVFIMSKGLKMLGKYEDETVIHTSPVPYLRRIK